MRTPGRVSRTPVAIAVALASVGAAAAPAPEQSTQPIEEVVVQGRLLDSAARLVDERLNDDAVTNIMGSEMIARIGDTDVAAALQRVSGLQLVNDKFVYVRGLGERYSSTTLNGARIPSVDLTRNVVPLDIFPTFIVDSLRVQKSYSTDRAATFGGGNIDIRTETIPAGLVLGVQVGSGVNSQTRGDVLTYSARGGDDSFGVDDGTRALADQLRGQISEYQGDISSQNILAALRARGNPQATTAEAQAINRQLAQLLNRNISLKETEADPDAKIQGTFGNSFFLTDELEMGFLVAGGYDSNWRETRRISRSFRFPDERTDERIQSTYQVAVTGNGNFGVRYGDEHRIDVTSLFLRNTDDETSTSTFFNENRQRSSGNAFQNVRQQYEERELLVNQIRGSHRIGALTRDLIDERLGFLPGGLIDLIPEEAEYSWYYSDSEAGTDIPNQVEVRRQGPTDENFDIVDPQVVFSTDAADYRFTQLDDEVQDHGWQLSVPFYLGDFFVDVAGGFAHNRKARTFEQTQFGLGPLNVDDIDLLSQPLGTVFGNASLTDPDNNFVLQRVGTNTQSYIAATMTDAWFGQADITWQDTWRLAGGLRWEQYRQAALDYDPFAFSVVTPTVPTDTETLQNSVFSRSDLYPAASLTYMGDWLAETFQVRLGYSETVTRPDLREITGASYIDPLTDELVFGNPGVRPAEITNYDLRFEWFFANADQFTVSLFYKEIADPIEFFEVAASDTTIAREIINAESAEITGVEFEFLKELGFLGAWGEPFFVQGNITIQDSELVAGAAADAPTSPVRELTNAAPWVSNMVFGFDSPDGQHSATLTYNVFDDRLFIAGRNGAPDGFEQTRHSLNVNYQWYPTDSITLQLKAQNLLDETLTIERAGVETFDEEIGRTVSASLQWNF